MSRAHGQGVEAKANPIRLLLADELTLLRSAMSFMLSLQPGMTVVAELPCDGPVAAAVAECVADIAIIGVDEASGHCVTTVREIRQSQPSCGVVALTMPDVPDTPGMYAQLLAAPVHAIVDKDSSAEALFTAIRAVADGGAMIPQAVLELARVARNPLSKREREVLAMAAQGETVVHIARILGLRAGTVRNYLSNAIAKTEKTNRVDAIQTARRYGWL